MMAVIKGILRIFAFLALLTSCSEDDSNPSTQTALSIVQNQQLFEDINSDLNQGTIESDDFELHEVNVEDMRLLIKVSYSGGCEQHEFEIIWPEVIIAIYPPDFSIHLETHVL